MANVDEFDFEKYANNVCLVFLDGGPLLPDSPLIHIVHRCIFVGYNLVDIILMFKDYDKGLR